MAFYTEKPRYAGLFHFELRSCDVRYEHSSGAGAVIRWFSDPGGSRKVA